MNIKELDSNYVAHTYARFPLEIVSGSGATGYDENGKAYIDLGSGIAVNTFGYCDSVWAEAVSAQAHKLQHTSNLYFTGPCVELAQMLCERTGMSKVFFGNSGAEANEGAIKAARRYSFLKYGESRSTIITLKNSFHGRTVTTLAATGQDVFHTEFGPFTEGFVYCTPDDLVELRRLTEENACCGIMIETIQGEGGIHVLSDEFVKGVESLCREKDLCMIVDEVQTGNGRTGKLYSYMHYGVQPDIVSTAKGLAGGLPLGAVMLSERVQSVFSPGSHGSTFGGNPVCCAGALSVLSRIDDELLGEVEKKSRYIIDSLTGAPGVKGISGRGLMLGIESDKSAKDVIAQCMENGVLVLSAKTKVRLLPPLNISWEELEKAIEILKEVLCK
ncbi:MAG: aspartate aminotransferase family protein [Candidatus Heteroscillospira sp.]|jgi:acetylornithine/N-succinyldiaminopimelate aminotransferase